MNVYRNPSFSVYLCILMMVAGLSTGCYRSGTLEDPLVAIQIQDRNGLTEIISTPDRLDNYREIDFLSSQPYKKILRVYKQKGKSHSKITTYHPNGLVWQYLEAEELRAYGAYREWYPSGQLKLEAYIIGGTADVAAGTQRDWLFDGKSQAWDEQGRLLATIPYENGSLEGVSLYYYPTGQIEKEMPYHRHLLEGDLIEYHPDGKLRAKTSYIKGNKQGISIGYFQGGQESWKEEYRENLLLKGTYYTPKGETLSSVEDGMGFRAIFEDQVLSMLIQIQQGVPEGGVKLFTSGGELASVYRIKNGRKMGEEVFYFLANERTDGKTTLLPKLSISWDEGVIHGSVKTWYSSGQLQSQRDFCRNKKMGPSLAWYKDGSLMLVEEYEEDRLLKGQYYRKNGIDVVSSVINGSGIATLYDEQGIFLRKITYVKGEPVDPE